MLYTPSLLQGRCPQISLERNQWICQTLTPGAVHSGGAERPLPLDSSQTFHPHSTLGRWGLETGFLALLHSQPLGRCRLFCLRPPAQHTYAVTRNQTPSSKRLSSPCPLPFSPWTPPHYSSQTLIPTSISLDSSPTLPMLRGGKETQQRGEGAL